VLFIEAPAQTGFSIGPIKSSDYEVAGDLVNAIVSFFRKFSDLKDQDFYIAGEGYSGVIAPNLASRIL
jgi:serine carboxypeptidase-like clade 2